MFVSTKDRYVRRAIGLKVTRNGFRGEVVHRLLLQLGRRIQHPPVNNFGEPI
jgi:hypothetical protein